MTIHIMDTNIISRLMGGHGKFTQKIQDLILTGDDIVFSALSYYEIKCGLQANTNPSKINLFDKIYQKFRIIFLNDRKIFDIASDIYRMLNNIGGLDMNSLQMDILIAATAIQFNFNVLTENTKDFKRIKSVEPRFMFESWSAS